MCVRSLRTRAAVRQRATFTVDLMKVMEQILEDDGGKGGPDGIIVGAALFSIYARVRIGDLRRCCTEPILDLVDGRGYVETEFLDHKTAVPGTRKALPIVAPAFGLTGPWAARWIATRRSAGLDAAKDMTVLPAMGEANVWTDVPFTTVEFASSVREVLLRHGVEPGALANIGAHSMKATLLSWAAKYGIAKPIRRTLGYHADANDKAVETYSRDAMAAPLRDLERVLEAVRAGSFHPDATRSGLFQKSDIDVHGVCGQVQETGLAARSVFVTSPRAPSPPLPRPALLLDHPSSSSSAPGPSGPRPASGSSGSASAASSSSEDPDVKTVAPDDSEAAQVVVNKVTRTYHLLISGSLMCKQAFSHRCEVVSDVPRGGRLCSRCF